MYKIALMNKARQEKKEDAEELSLTQSYNLLKNQYSHLQKQYNELLLQFKKKENTFKTSNPILNDLYLHDENDYKEYCEETLELCLKIRTISPQIYKLISDSLPFPSQNQIEEDYQNIIKNIPEKLININLSGEIIKMWKNTHNIKNDLSINACLSVDALYFKPDAEITIENCVKSMAFSDTLQSYFPDNCFEYFSKNPDSLQTFINLNWNQIIKAGFVFQIQPFNIKYDSFIAHIRPTANGKASDDIIDLLHEIRKICKKYRINIKSYAFDGDRAYRHLHISFYESYINSIIQKNSIVTKTKSNKLRISSDYPHLTKRLRYRLLSHSIHSGFTKNSPLINIDSLKKILSNVPNVVWLNESFTKMNDRLPNELFKIDNFLKLFNAGEFAAAAYWFPISLSDIAINTSEVGFEIREFLLECSFYFLIFYKKCFENAKEITLLQQKSKENTNVMFYDDCLLIEFTNTIYSHIQLMNIEEEFYFQSNSTTPLEHKFGFARARARDIHTLTKFLQTISAYQSFQRVKNECIEMTNIRGRIHKKVICEHKEIQTVYTDDDVNIIDELPYSPQSIALYILHLAGFNVCCYCENSQTLPFWINELLDPYCCSKEINVKKKITCNTGKLGTDQCPRIKSRITGLPPGTTRKYMKKYEYKEKLFQNLCMKKLGHYPNKKELLEIMRIITDKDNNCENPPNKNDSKKIIYDWIVNHINLYLLLLDNYNNNSNNN